MEGTEPFIVLPRFRQGDDWGNDIYNGDPLRDFPFRPVRYSGGQSAPSSIESLAQDLRILHGESLFQRAGKMMT